MFVERVRDLQPTDEHGDSHVVIVFIHHSHLALGITDILLEALPRLYFDGEGLVDVLQLQLESVLVVEGLLTSSKLWRDCLESILNQS